MEDLDLSPIANGFYQIRHLEMLDASRLSVLLQQDEGHTLMLVNLETREVISSIKVTPRPVG